jgi:hypothetical protein
MGAYCSFSKSADQSGCSIPTFQVVFNALTEETPVNVLFSWEKLAKIAYLFVAVLRALKRF